MELQKQISTAVSQLNHEQQARLLDFINSLNTDNAKVGMAAKKVGRFAQFAGTISDKDLNIMETAIKERFEKVDENNWKFSL